MKRAAMAAILVGLGATAASAQQVPMHEDPQIRQGFYDFYLAREVDDNCPSISISRWKVLGFYNSMISYARSAGYTRADFDAMEDDDAVKDAFRAELRGDLAERGATRGNPQGYCQVGREEMAADSRAGSFLRGN